MRWLATGGERAWLPTIPKLTAQLSSLSVVLVRRSNYCVVLFVCGAGGAL